MKKKWLLLPVFCMMITLLSLHYVKANDLNDATQVFPEEEVDELIKEIEKKEVLPDKVDFLREKGSTPSELSLRSIVIPPSTGGYPRRKGVILVTGDAYKGLIPTGHAAIIYDYNTVIESGSKGVVWGSNNWYDTKKTCYAVTVKRTNPSQDVKAADWCKKQIGKPYNMNLFNTSTRKAFYCSQLVWAAFLDNFNIDLNTSEFGVAIHPMELVNTSQTTLLYKK